MKLDILLISVFSAISVVFNQEIWDDKNFDSNLASSGSAFVKFFAPWCGHCKQLAPTWSELAANPSIKTKIVKVDCTADGKALCSRFGVNGYPTLKFISLGEDGKQNVDDYDGGRNLDGLLSFVESKTLPSFELATSETIESFMKPKKKPTLVAFTDGEQSELVKRIKKASSSLRDFVSVVYTVDPAIPKSVGNYAVGTILFIREECLWTVLDTDKVEIPSDTTDIVSAVTNLIPGKVGFRRRFNEKTFKRPLLVVYVDLDHQKDPSRFKMIRNRIIKLSVDTDLKMAIAQKSDFSEEISELPVYTSQIIALIQRQDGRRYLLEKTFNFDQLASFVESMKQFLDDYKNNKLQVYIKSAPVPTSDDGPVKVVVGSTFEEIVMDESKDVLIEMYAPWCGHCKALEPKYTELAQKLKNNKNLVIAKMDATENDSPPEYPVHGFPTIFFAPKGRKSNPTKYDGERDVEGFIKWLNEHATTKPVVADSKDEL